MYKKNILRLDLLLAILLSLILSGCGGGGGGSGSGSSSGRNASTGIRLIQAAIDYGPMGVYVSGGPGTFISKAGFADISYHGSADAGLLNLNVASTDNIAAALWSGGVDLAGGQRKSILVFGGYKDKDLSVSVINDSPAIPEKSFAYFRLINGIAGASSAHASVPTLVQTAAVKAGQGSAYVAIAPGLYDFLVNADGADVGKVSGSISAGKAYSVVSQGAAGYLVSTNLLED